MFVAPEITTEWIERLIATPEGRDRLEAFVGKFSRFPQGVPNLKRPHPIF